MSAINEILPKATGVGKIDPNSNGTGEIFNGYEDLLANVASGDYSHAEGSDTKATGSNSHAEGCGTTASATNSHAEGSFTTASGADSHAEGNMTTAIGRQSHAEGYNTEAIGARSHAEGGATEATGNYSHAEGYITQTFSQSEHAEGSYNKSYSSEDDSVRVIHSVGIGSSGSNRKNAHEIKFNGDHYIYGVGGFNGTNSADAQTLQEVVNSKQDTTDNNLDTTDKTIVGAINEILPKVTGVGKIDPNSNGTGEIFNYYEGNGANVASGEWSHAEGGYATASGMYSHAEGSFTTASGNSSHAEGTGTIASGFYSHAEGLSTQAFGNAEHAEGQSNKSYDSTSPSVRVIHSVGIGSSNLDRKNAHEIKFNGDHYVYGVGGFDGTNSDTAQTLQTVLANLAPNIIEVPELTGDYNIPANATNREFLYIINIGATLYSVTGDSSILWAGGIAPNPSANSVLVVSIVKNLATWNVFMSV